MQTHALAVALLFIAFGEPLYAQKSAAAAELAVLEGAPLTVSCQLPVEQRADWTLDGRAAPPDMRAAESTGARGVTARLHAAAAAPRHAGVYSCGAGAAVRVRLLPRSPGSSEGPAVAASTAASLAPAPEGPEPVDFLYDLGRTFRLNCSTVAVAGDTYTWSVNGSAVAEGGHAAPADGGAALVVSRAGEDEHGLYACASSGGAARVWRVGARAVARLPADSGVVEGQAVKLSCKLIGKPYPAVTWYWAPVGSDNHTEASAVFGARVTLRPTAAGVTDGELLLAAATATDAGNFTCAPQLGVSASTVLRVKDMYAALWPFLGICAEVLVLCAVILVYERRRTKPELDDSDTDNHDQ